MGVGYLGIVLGDWEKGSSQYLDLIVPSHVAKEYEEWLAQSLLLGVF